MYRISKEVIKRIDGEQYYSIEEFIADAKSYIKAVKSGRALFEVTHVSNSGMSRNISVLSYEGTMNKGYYRNYTRFFEALGYKLTNGGDVKIGGCGMNMLFKLNYDVINTLKYYGFIREKTAKTLAQKIN